MSVCARVEGICEYYRPKRAQKTKFADPCRGLIDPTIWKKVNEEPIRKMEKRLHPELNYGPEQVVAYAVQRLPACYAAMW